MGFGYREVIIDQPFSEKWTEVDMNLGGGHGTFHGIKYSVSAGGFSYRTQGAQKSHVQNRFIYWRVLNDTLELTENSFDYNLEDNQLRIVFPDSPIVSPITVQETGSSVVILVATVTTINKFVFSHPNKAVLEDPKLLKTNKLPSIFSQAIVKPLMNFNSFALFEHSVNIPAPTTAASCIMPNNSEYVFALSYESGSVTICKITKDETTCFYDLRQANVFARILSYTPSIFKPTASSTSPDAVVGLNFFTAKIERDKRDLYLLTLSMNGHLRLYVCGNPIAIDSWIQLADILVDKRFGIAGYTDSALAIRKYHHNSHDYPKFAVFVPGEGFKVFQCLRDTRGPGPPKLVLDQINAVLFKEKSLVDFAITSSFLYILVSNPDEETDWEIKTFDLNELLAPRFNLALLEPPPQADVSLEAADAEPKEFYSDLIFNKSSFSVSTIYSALSMFRSSKAFPKSENDWELTKFYALRVIESEVRATISEFDEPMSDMDMCERNHKFWGEFYTSCVEYHINTVKPFGLFYEYNSNLVCIVKKGRISFLRPTSFLESALYFPHLIAPNDAGGATNTANVLKYLDVIELLESAMVESQKLKIKSRILEDKYTSMEIWNELANVLLDTNPRSEVLERRHFLSMLTKKLQELASDGSRVIKYMVDLMSSWDNENESQDQDFGTDAMDETEGSRLSTEIPQFLMGSRLGANLTYRTFKQLIAHRYMIARNTLLLQSIVRKIFSLPDDEPGTSLWRSFGDQGTAHRLLFRCFSFLSLCDRSGEFLYENWSENARKVGNLLNCRSSEQLVHGKSPDFWPIKLVEFFCYSSFGGTAIRSRVNDSIYSKVLACASAVGCSLWINEDSAEHPFEEFLVAAGQYKALAYYAAELECHRKSQSEVSLLGIFYNCVSNLFIRSPDAALCLLMTISTAQLKHAPFFSSKILGLTEEPVTVVNAFYEKGIKLFQIFGYAYGIQRLSQKALTECLDDRSLRITSVLGFKNALGLGDYDSAFEFILKMPTQSVGSNGQLLHGKERESSIRNFVTSILKNRDVDVLVGLKTDGFGAGIREDIESVLHAQAKLSDPLAEDSVYQMIYFYHLCSKNFEKAAMIMLERITEVGLKGKGRTALEVQREAYLDILTCISLMNAGTKDMVQTSSSDTGAHYPEEWLNVLQNKNISSPESHPVEEHCDIKERVKSYEKLYRECELCISLLLLTDDKEVGPLKYSMERERAEMCATSLIRHHQYDQAINISRLWDLSYVPILKAFAMTCINLVYRSKSGDSDVDYLRHLAIDDLPNSNAGVIDLAYLILQNYIFTLEKPRETKLHQEVSLILLRHNVSLPRWLADSYKKRDANQLILCYMRFGYWEEAAELVLEVLDVALGRRDSKEFDPSIKPVSPYESTPIIPYNTIEDLANQINQRILGMPKLQMILQNLRERCDDYVVRVLETRQERRLMFVH